MARQLESKFQAVVIDAFEAMFPGCMVMKNDSSYIQGVPDLILLWGPHWATFEVKRGLDEPFQPNQEYYINRMNEMSFSAMICPENMGEVLDALQQSFRARRPARVPQRQ